MKLIRYGPGIVLGFGAIVFGFVGCLMNWRHNDMAHIANGILDLYLGVGLGAGLLWATMRRMERDETS